MSKFKMGDVIKVVNDEAKISEGDGLIVDIDGEYYVVKWPSCELTGKHLQKYIDHIAVSLNKRHNMPLVLHLPAHWDFVTGQYMDTRDGRTANYYHRQFSSQIGQDSLKSLNSALQRESVSHTISTDFKARNALVAQSEIIYALTWGDGDIPTPGGTRHTWDLAKGVKRHWSLNRFVR